MNVEDFRTALRFQFLGEPSHSRCLRALTPEQFTRDLGSSFGSVRDTLVHICGAEWIWLERWHGRAPTAIPKRGGFPGLRIGAPTLGRGGAQPSRLCRLAHARGCARGCSVQGLSPEFLRATAVAMLAASSRTTARIIAAR